MDAKLSLQISLLERIAVATEATAGSGGVREGASSAPLLVDAALGAARGIKRIGLGLPRS